MSQVYQTGTYDGLTLMPLIRKGDKELGLAAYILYNEATAFFYVKDGGKVKLLSGINPGAVWSDGLGIGFTEYKTETEKLDLRPGKVRAKEEFDKLKEESSDFYFGKNIKELNDLMNVAVWKSGSGEIRDEYISMLKEKESIPDLGRMLIEYSIKPQDEIEEKAVRYYINRVVNDKSTELKDLAYAASALDLLGERADAGIKTKDLRKNVYLAMMSDDEEKLIKYGAEAVKCNLLEGWLALSMAGKNADKDITKTIERMAKKGEDAMLYTYLAGKYLDKNKVNNALDNMLKEGSLYGYGYLMSMTNEGDRTVEDFLITIDPSVLSEYAKSGAKKFLKKELVTQGLAFGWKAALSIGGAVAGIISNALGHYEMVPAEGLFSASWTLLARVELDRLQDLIKTYKSL